MDGWIIRASAWLDGWVGAGGDGLRGRKRKQVGSHRPCSGRSRPRADAGAGAGAGGAISSQELGSSAAILELQPSPGTSRTWMALNWMARLDRHRSSLGSARPVQGDRPARAGPPCLNLQGTRPGGEYVSRWPEGVRCTGIHCAHAYFCMNLQYRVHASQNWTSTPCCGSFSLTEL